MYTKYQGLEKKAIELVGAEVGKTILRDKGVYTLHTLAVEKINDNLFEYRISNPNYRIYYTREDDKLIILLSLRKDRSDISRITMNKLMKLKNNKYEKLVN